jgi:hypothetical protein
MGVLRHHWILHEKFAPLIASVMSEHCSNWVEETDDELGEDLLSDNRRSSQSRPGKLSHVEVAATFVAKSKVGATFKRALVWLLKTHGEIEVSVVRVAHLLPRG